MATKSKTFELTGGKVGKSYAYFRQDLADCLVNKKEFGVSGMYVAKNLFGGKMPKKIKVTIEA